MNVSGFYGISRPRGNSGLPSGMPTQMEKVSETLTVLETAQQSNAASIKTVLERVDALAKDFDEFKKQVATPPSAPVAHDGQSSSRRLPSELSVSY
jgi:hypothetical protein